MKKLIHTMHERGVFPSTFLLSSQKKSLGTSSLPSLLTLVPLRCSSPHTTRVLPFSNLFTQEN